MTREQIEQATFQATVERLINAAPEAVFDAFMVEASQAQWFAGPEDEVISMTIEPRVGGAWDVEFRHAGETYGWRGTFIEVDRPHRFAAELMNTHPGEEDFASTFVVTCEPRGGQTLLSVTEGHINTRHRDDAAGGLPGVVDIVQRIAEQGSTLR